MASIDTNVQDDDIPDIRMSEPDLSRSTWSDANDASVDTKRYAAYFASTTNLGKLLAAADAGQKWDIVPTTVISAQSPDATCKGGSSTSASNTEVRSRGSQFAAPVANIAQLVPSINGEMPPDTDTHPIVPKLRPRYDPAIHDGLTQACREAIEIMEEQGLSEQDRISCNRPECHGILRNVAALTRHIHIHNLHDRSFPCLVCGGLYDTRRERSMHICRVQPKPSLTKGFFLYIISRILCNRNE